MLIVVYRCENFEAMVGLLGNLDQSESMEVEGLSGDRYGVTYKSRLLLHAATDVDIPGVTLVMQDRL